MVKRTESFQLLAHTAFLIRSHQYIPFFKKNSFNSSSLVQLLLFWWKYLEIIHGTTLLKLKLYKTEMYWILDITLIVIVVFHLWKYKQSTILGKPQGLISVISFFTGKANVCTGHKELICQKSWPSTFSSIQYMFWLFSQTVIRVYGDVQFAFLRRNIFEWDQFNLKNHSYKNFFWLRNVTSWKKKKDLALITYWGRNETA